MKYDIFISYRREGGADKARILKTELTAKGYKVFLDFDELKDGIFNERIIQAIESAPIFMLLLSEKALDRCCNEDDWVRKEIEYAIKTERHIIPINLDLSFGDFPSTIPINILNEVKQHQISEIMFGQLFQVSVDKMINDRIKPILVSNDKTIKHLTTSRNRLVIISAIVIIFLTIAIVAIVYFFKENTQQAQFTPEVPITHNTISHDVTNESNTEDYTVETTLCETNTSTNQVAPNNNATSESYTKSSVSNKEIKAEIEESIKHQFELFKNKYPQITSYNAQAFQEDLFSLDGAITQLIKNFETKYNPNDEYNLQWIKDYCNDIKSEQYTELNAYVNKITQQQLDNDQIETNFTEEIRKIYYACFNEHYYDTLLSSNKKGMDQVYIQHKEKAEAAAKPLIDAVIQKYTQQYPDMTSRFLYLDEATLRFVLREHDDNMTNYYDWQKRFGNTE